MKKLIQYTCLLALSIILLQACKKDNYIVGGSLHNPKYNGTTYEYLHTNRLFDTLLIVIDKLGMKDEINANNTTFFAPTNYCFNNYVKQIVQERKRIQQNDENLVVNFNDLDLNSLRDSIRAYIFPGRIVLDSLDKNGKMITAMDGEQRLVRSIEDPSVNVGGTNFTDLPKYLFLTKIYGTRDPDNLDSLKLIPDSQKDETSIIQTSGIITNNGVLHVMSNYHILTFAKLPK
ncbi:fasciclin domain-containing protein [Chitinophaga dinghuensis]|uniref:Fasciclin domain-containing protein n=1 Tax=Chitinophaga dinghuensis TaxID=1539050 RepID=A0A327W0M2_9BACT|nr:fasciclin domain-containing protein [Chitinophaga dinghuensis]RAJ81785.1 fasciclin domain-containing protein [Chitinophaga dinghuensis]